MRKDIFQHMSSWSQLFFLCLFFFVGLVLLAIFSVFMMKIDPALVTNVNFLKFSVVLQSTLLFFIPSFLCAYLFYAKPTAYLKINKKVDFKFLILSLLIIIAIQPLISYTAYLNNSIEFPESMRLIENQMRIWEDSAKVLMEKFLLTDSIGVLIINILVIGVVAGVTEEFFFRGSIQQLINKITHNTHVAIWITAFIFSAVHFQFFGFIPRLLLGALLGYLFVWSGNLWIPIIVHTVNNTLSVLAFHFFHDSEVYNTIENIGTGSTSWSLILSILVVGLIVFILLKEYSAKRINNDEYSSY